MATMVDLEKVKEIIKDYFAGIRKNIFAGLDELAYGKTYECWSCGEPIYANELEKKWIHVDTGKRLCVLKSAMSDEYISVSNYAIPKPDDMEASVAHHAECVYCKQRVYYANGEWYHCDTGDVSAIQIIT